MRNIKTIKLSIILFFILILIAILSGCNEIHDEIFIKIDPVEGQKIIERAMFSSNNGYSNELYFMFKNPETQKDISILTLIKPASVILEQETGRKLNVGDIKPGTMAAIYYDETDFTEGLPKKSAAIRVVILANQQKPQTIESISTEDYNLVKNTVIEYINNNTITLLLNRTLEEPQHLKVYFTQNTKFYGLNGQEISNTALKRGSICTIFLPKNGDIFGRNMLSYLFVTP